MVDILIVVERESTAICKMADVFGDLDLFSEFEKDREAQGSFIHYDEETAKSRIIFEDYKSESEDESEEETEHNSGKEPSTDAAKSSTTEIQEDVIKKEITSEDGEVIDPPSEKISASGDNSGANIAESKKAGTASSAEDEKRVAWLNAQLYAEAAEEANKQDKSAQQLIYERILNLT